jgi:methionine sulfoxide reductase heme-binding subunit
MNLRKLPWYDYREQFSPLKALVLAALFVPGIWTAVSYDLGLLGARPVTEAIHQFGDWAIRLIFIALAISPARIVLQWPQLLQVRRLVGVAAFAYVLVHLSLYVADEAFNIPTVVSEIVLRIYLLIGFTALLGLGVLAITSTDGWQRRLRARRWQKLHRIVYAIAFLAIIHFFLQSKLEEWEPTVMAGIYLWLMGCRAIVWRYGRGKMPVSALALMSVAAAVLTAVGEAFYFWIAMGAPFGLVLMANFSLETGLRPGWVVLASTGALTLLGALRGLIKPRSKARLSAA